MKTELMLMVQTDGRPVMNVDELAKLLHVVPRTVQNKIYKKALPFPAFQLEGSSDWFVHLADVAAHIDAQRALAAKAAD